VSARAERIARLLVILRWRKSEAVVADGNDRRRSVSSSEGIHHQHNRNEHRQFYISGADYRMISSASM
jgi:hypothetical protein